VDVLFHLRKEEFFKRAEEANPSPSVSSSADAAAPLDAMSKLASHLLRQRRLDNISYWPILIHID
jgi:DNA polymerase alpha subunit B